MQANDEALTKLINGTVQFVIPVFQRDYSWTEEQCEQLWADIMTVSEGGSDARHFLGSIVYTATEDTSAAFTRWMLIDGQQRLTTVMLLLIALRDHLRKSQWQGEDPTPRRLDAQLLRNLEEAGPKKPKLVLRRHDQHTLRALLDGDEPPSSPSDRSQENYDFFLDRVSTADPAAVYRGIGRLEIVDVKLGTADDPQLIFESLNSTGLDLSQSDLIRNFILMGLPEPEQTRLYELIWHKIELLFRGNETKFDNFARDYVALKTEASKQGRADEIYQVFRRAFPGFCRSAGGLEEALREMLRFARYYAAFALGKDAEAELEEPLWRLRRLVDVPATLVMRLFDCHDRARTLSTADFGDALRMLESYVFRRAVCGLQTRGYWVVFAGMAYRIEEERPLESLRVRLALQSENYRFPSNQEFQGQLQERDIYGRRVCLPLLERLENYDTKEPTETGQLTIEHILPQNERLPSSWREMLGPDWREIQERWLHRLGNLTLTGYNSEYSDRPFAEKKSIPGGFEDSAVRLNRFVQEQQVWTEREIRERGRLLSAWALEAWPRLEVAPGLIEEARQVELRERAEGRSATEVNMSQKARKLFDLLGPRIRKLDSDVVELAESRSVSYHAPDFFLEVLPRKHRLLLLLVPDFNEIDDADGIAGDATEWKFLVGSKYEGGVTVNVKEPEDVERAMPLVRQALALISG